MPRRRERREDKENQEPLVQRISQIFLGEAGLYKYDGFLKRQLERSGLSQEQLESAHRFIRWSEENHIIVSYENDPKTHELIKEEKEYVSNTRDILRVVEIAKKVDKVHHFAQLVFSVVSIESSEFGRVLDVLDHYAGIEGIENALEELSSLQGFEKQGLHSIDLAEDGLGLTRSDYHSGSRHESTELATYFLKKQEDSPDIFSEKNKERYKEILELFKEKSAKFRRDREFSFPPSMLPLLFDIISNDEMFDLFTSYYKKVYDLSSNIALEVRVFVKMYELIPDIAELFDEGFYVNGYVSSILGNRDFVDLVTSDTPSEEIREQLEEIMPGLAPLKTILADETFCRNAEVLSRHGLRVSPNYNVRFVNQESKRYPYFYEVRPTEVIEKIGTFYQYGYTKLGFNLPSGDRTDPVINVLDRQYSDLSKLFSDVPAEEVERRLKIIPGDFFSKLTKKEKVAFGRDESMFLLEKIFGFSSDEALREWVQDMMTEDSLDAIHSQNWIAEYLEQNFVHDYDANERILEFLFDSSDVKAAIERLYEAGNNIQEVIKFSQELKQHNVSLEVKKVAHIVRLSEYSLDQRQLLLKILKELDPVDSGTKHLYDRNFALIDTILQYPESVTLAVSAFMQEVGDEHFKMRSLFIPDQSVNVENVTFLFENIDVIVQGHQHLAALVPDTVKPSHITGMSRYNLGPFIRNLFVFGQNPALTETLKKVSSEFDFHLKLKIEGVAESLVKLSEDPSLISTAKELKERAGYFNFDPRDYAAFSVLSKNTDLLKKIFVLSEDMKYYFQGRDLQELENYLGGKNAEERMNFITFIGETFYGYRFEINHLKSYQRVENLAAIKELLKMLADTSYRFASSDVVTLSEIASDPGLQTFVVEMLSLGVKFQAYDLDSYKQLLQKRDEVIDFLQQDPAHGSILSANIAHFKEAVPENLSAFLKMVVEIETSQSQDIRALKDQLIEQLRSSPNPDVAWKEIEAVFVRNHLPLVGKVFKIFEIIYPSEKVDAVLEAHPATSPQLRNSGRSRRRYTIYRDLLNTHVRTGNRSLEQYLVTFSLGSTVCQKFEREGFESLSEEEKYKLHEFLDRAQTLYTNSNLDLVGKKTQLTRSDELDEPMSEQAFAERLNKLKEAVGISGQDSLFDRLNVMYAKPLGKDSIRDLLEEMQNARQEADERGRSLYIQAQQNGGKLNLTEGNLLKAVNQHYFHLIGQNGSVSQEFLGPSAGSDLTPLDTDLSIIPEEHVLLEGDERRGFKEILGASNSAPGIYGDLVFVIRDRGQFNRTDVEEVPDSLIRVGQKEFRPELFKTGALGETHYGIRTGFPITEVDFMIFGPEMGDEVRESVLMEIAKNGYYIPIVDEEGSILFTPEQFEELRTVFAGINHISREHVSINMSEIDEGSRELSSTLDNLVGDIQKSREVIEVQTQLIFDLVQETLQELGISMLDPHSGSLLGAHLENTGSTARGTNSIGDADFDMLLFLDALDYDQRENFQIRFIDKLNPESDQSYSDLEFTQIRAKGVQYPGLEGADLDIGLMAKSEERGFASHDAVAAKLADVEGQYGGEVRDKVLANIVYAKNYLKSEEAYGSHLGCLFGIALENLIIQNDGNFVTAFRRYVDAAERVNMSFEQFKKEFPVWNAGRGARAQTHENYTAEMTEQGFKKTYEVMSRLLKSVTADTV